MGEWLSFSLPFLIIRIKTSKLKQNHLWCWNLCLFLRKFLKNYLSWICWQRMSGAQLLQMSSPLKLIVGVRVWLCWSESSLTWQQKDLWALVKCYRWVALGSSVLSIVWAEIWCPVGCGLSCPVGYLHADVCMTLQVPSPIGWSFVHQKVWNPRKGS